MVIEKATEADLQAILDLLAAAALPLDGFATHISSSLILREGDRVVGSAALEVYEDAALLRSLAVAEPLRGQGAGKALVDAILTLARDKQIPAVYLITETAEDFFRRLYGFTAIPRGTAPKSLHASAEFNGACPDSAVTMRLLL